MSTLIGASLYIPATHRRLPDFLSSPPLQLTSIIVCLEDSLRAEEVPQAETRATRLLQQCRPGLELWVRPRTPEMLARLATRLDPAQVAGFVLPKFDNTSMEPWLGALTDRPYKLMPTLETRESFDAGAMARLRDRLLEHPCYKQLYALRVGGNDLLALLGLRRPKGLMLYDTPLGYVLGMLITTFKPWGFALTAPVFDQLEDRDGLEREAERDVLSGFAGKTAVHPQQVEVINRAFKVTPCAVAEATRILDVRAPAVFTLEGAMAEPATHRSWAVGILARASIFGMESS
jgi:citrate lyase beta subunit